ncbi:flavonol synthase/flavanone 3-hydroxylase-like [Lolium rigidum]|uniref:flavonol synthase/flavanone 3-hydroxylase-like n=1 Tax=Lolium rigidum TaxID=89674 RepID=UPI001F5C5623|nr:flavonol synthase/flavanone 3-hydroxylase-like [Lolium rigidum]
MAGAMQSVHAHPPEFARSAHEQPCATTFHGAAAPPEIPVIDMSSPHAGRAMAGAAREWGIFQVVNHGVPASAVSELQRVGREFFALPQEEKQRYAMDPSSGKTEGYGSTLQRDGPGGKKTWADFLFHNVAPPSAVNHSVWPENPKGYRAANEAYCGHMRRLTRTLFERLSAGLGLEEGAMAEAFGGDEVIFLQKINFYPPCPQPDLALGVAPHTDLSTLTVLVPNEVPGLQVFRDGQWHDVEYVPGALIVHIGDQIEILSNGRYKAVLHRTTVSKEKTRMSWPVFVEPPTEHVVGPHLRLVTDEYPAKYKAKKFKDYKYCKINKLPQ